MRERLVRIPVSGTTVRFGDRTGELVNIGLRGALLRLDGPVTAGTQMALTLTRNLDVMEVAARVTRSESTEDAQLPWSAAVEFVAMSDAARRMIPRFIAS